MIKTIEIFVVDKKTYKLEFKTLKAAQKQLKVFGWERATIKKIEKRMEDIPSLVYIREESEYSSASVNLPEGWTQEGRLSCYKPAMCGRFTGKKYPWQGDAKDMPPLMVCTSGRASATGRKDVDIASLLNAITTGKNEYFEQAYRPVQKCPTVPHDDDYVADGGCFVTFNRQSSDWDEVVNLLKEQK